MITYILVFKPQETLTERVLICIDEGVLAFVNVVSFGFAVSHPSLVTLKVIGKRSKRNGHVGYIVIGVIALSIGKNFYFVAKNTMRDYRRKKAEKRAAKEKAREEQKVIREIQQDIFEYFRFP